MTIFALDSSGKTAGVALWQNNTLMYEVYLADGHTHSETLLSLCQSAFSATGLTPAHIDLFAVNLGPGSFTGLRIGLGLIKGLAFATNAPCAPVSTLEALAYSAGAQGVIASALDARRGEVYGALFRRDGEQLTRLTADGALPAAAFAQEISLLSQPATCLGDGAQLVIDAATAAGLSGLTLSPATLRLGRASGVCLAAQALWACNACVSAAQLSPQYHRLSQAQRQRAEALQEGSLL